MSSRSIRSVAHYERSYRGCVAVWFRLADQIWNENTACFTGVSTIEDAGLILGTKRVVYRNAPMFLSQLGVQRLTEDSVAK